MKILVVFILYIIYSTSIIFASSVNNNLVLEDGKKIKTFGAQKKSIRKCCQKNQYFNSNFSCEDFKQDFNFDFSIIPVYSERNLEQKINKTIRDLFYLKPGRFEEKLMEEEFNESYFMEHAKTTMLYDYNFVLSENGFLYFESPNHYVRWEPVKYFCVDYLIENITTTPIIWFITSARKMRTPTPWYTAALLVSSFFLLLVLLVYILLPELRNLVGLVLMAYVLSQMCAFIFLLSIEYAKFYKIGCITMTALTYFFLLATFCWMNVMSYDIWWTFRGYAKARKIHRRGEKFKFCMYCIYAWGVPLLMTVMLVIINSMDLRHMPWFVTPRIPAAGCFLEGGEKLIYLYIPISILNLCNWCFFFMTVFNIWRLSRGTAAVNLDAAGNPAAHRNQRNRFMVYLKLSLVMGINWMLEVVSVFSPNLILWKFTDMYNLLIGLAIFLIFVCKKKIYKKLYDRYINKHESSSIP